jgi:hypothetical protein
MQQFTQYRKGLTALGAAAVLAALGACSGAATSPSAVGDTQITEDIASVAGNAIAEETNGFGTEDTQSGAADVALSPGNRLAASASAMRPSRELASCTQGSFSGTITFPFSDPRDTLSVARTWSFFAGGVCQNAFDASTTDSIVFNATVAEELHGKLGFWQAHRDDQRTHWVTGAPTLRGATSHVWNGFGAGVDTSSFSGSGPESRAYVGAAADTVTNVAFPHPRDGALYPASGTFTRWLNAMATFSGPTTGSRQIARHLVVTFNGTSIVPIVFYNVSNGQVALTCQLDLSIGEIVAGSCM